MFVITLVRIDWKKEAEKAMKCARGSTRETLSTLEQDKDDKTTSRELSQENEDFLVMTELDTSDSEMRLSEGSTKDSEQGAFHCNDIAKIIIVGNFHFHCLCGLVSKCKNCTLEASILKN